MELKHFVHFVGAPQGSDSMVQPERQCIGIWDARTYSQRKLDEQISKLLREFEVSETSRFDLMPWLRAILIVSPQPSDALALLVMNRGVLVLEALQEQPGVQVIEEFLQQVWQFQGVGAGRANSASDNPSSLTNAEHTNTESEFSRTPAYFNQALYDEWLGKLAQPWRSEETSDSES